jgi:hypothetical protein
MLRQVYPPPDRGDLLLTRLELLANRWEAKEAQADALLAKLETVQPIAQEAAKGARSAVIELARAILRHELPRLSLTVAVAFLLGLVVAGVSVYTLAIRSRPVFCEPQPAGRMICYIETWRLF